MGASFAQVGIFETPPETERYTAGGFRLQQMQYRERRRAAFEIILIPAHFSSSDYMLSQYYIFCQYICRKYIKTAAAGIPETAAAEDLFGAGHPEPKGDQYTARPERASLEKEKITVWPSVVAARIA